MPRLASPRSSVHICVCNRCVSAPHGHAHSDFLSHSHPLGYGHAHRYAHSHSHEGYTALAPKSATGGANGTGNIVTVSGLAPGGTTSISWVNSSRSGRSLGSGGSAGSMEEVTEGQDRDADGGKVGESVTNPIPIVGGKTQKREVEYKCESCNKVGWFDSFLFCLFFSFLFLVEL